MASQEEFIGFMEQLYDCACRDDKQVLLYLDPMHQVHNNENDYAWQLKGRQGTKTVQANTGRRRLNIIGAINPVTFEQTIVLTEANCCAEVIEVFLGEVKKQYADAGTICILLDNARYQRSSLVQQKAKDSNIDLVYLPAYSPNLNLIERVWRYFKKKVMKNRYYPDFDAFEEQVYLFFKNFDERIPDMKSLLNFKFGIIKAN